MEPGAPGAAHWPGAPSRTGPSSSRGSPADQRQYRRTCVGNSETEEIPLRGRVRFPNGRGQLREAGTQERPPDNEGDLCQSARPSETCDRPGAAQSRSRGVRGDASGSDAAASRAASPRRAGARGASARLGTNRGGADRNRIAIPRIVGRDCAEYPARHDGGTVHRATPLEPGIARSKHRAEDAVDSAAAIDRRGPPDTRHRRRAECVWAFRLGYIQPKSIITLSYAEEIAQEDVLARCLLAVAIHAQAEQGGARKTRCRSRGGCRDPRRPTHHAAIQSYRGRKDSGRDRSRTWLDARATPSRSPWRTRSRRSEERRVGKESRSRGAPYG